MGTREKRGKVRIPQIPNLPRSTPRERQRNQKKNFTSRENYTQLNTSRAEVLVVMENMEGIRWPKKSDKPDVKKDQSKYCSFHKNHVHTTNSCRHLKDEIENLIKKGYLAQSVPKECKPPTQHQNRNNDDRDRDRADNRVIGEVFPISGGFESRGSNRAANKSHAREARTTPPPRQATSKTPLISFNDDDLQGIRVLHDDALVISPLIANFKVKRVMVDTRSSADILALSAFKQISAQ